MRRIIQTVFIATAIAFIAPSIAANQCDTFNGQWKFDNEDSKGTVVIQGKEPKDVTNYVYDKEEHSYDKPGHGHGQCQSQDGSSKLSIYTEDGDGDTFHWTLELVSDHQAKAVIDLPEIGYYWIMMYKSSQ